MYELTIFTVEGMRKKVAARNTQQYEANNTYCHLFCRGGSLSGLLRQLETKR